MLSSRRISLDNVRRAIGESKEKTSVLNCSHKTGHEKEKTPKFVKARNPHLVRLLGNVSFVLNSGIMETLLNAYSKISEKVAELIYGDWDE